MATASADDVGDVVLFGNFSFTDPHHSIGFFTHDDFETTVSDDDTEIEGQVSGWTSNTGDTICADSLHSGEVDEHDGIDADRFIAAADADEDDLLWIAFLHSVVESQEVNLGTETEAKSVFVRNAASGLDRRNQF